MRKFLLLFFLVPALPAFPQGSMFSQYNGSLSAIDPAYIAQIDKDQVSLIARNQWPGYKLGSFNSEFTFNKFSRRINSGFGLIADNSYSHSGSFHHLSEGIQYGYRLLFFQRYYLCAGLGIEHQKLDIDVNNYYFRYFPKMNFITAPENRVFSESLNYSYGFIINDAEESQYIGVSFRDNTFKNLQPDSVKQLKNAPSLSIHAMKKIPVTRIASLFVFFNMERSGRISYVSNDDAGTTIQPSFYSYFLQFNLFFNKNSLIGMGYKYLPGNYGSINFRFAFLPRIGNYMAIGYSFDTKPYIQYDKIHFISSHEFYIKYNFPSKT